jgi:hypothetical protein
MYIVILAGEGKPHEFSADRKIDESGYFGFCGFADFCSKLSSCFAKVKNRKVSKNRNLN